MSDKTADDMVEVFNPDGQHFIKAGGYRGPQLATIQPGKYYINPLLFDVSKVKKLEVPPGFVSVIRSNVGVEVAKSADSALSVDQARSLVEENIGSEIEHLLTPSKYQRGIIREPITPGKYNLNTLAFTAYPVPTSAIMIDWASDESPQAPSMSRPSTTPDKDSSSYPYLTDPSKSGEAYFKFNQLTVTSKDGFELKVDVRMIIRILPENASFVIARFGSVFNLIQQIAHPLIDAEFRNSAGEKKALEFVQSRSALQQEAFDKAQTAFARYLVETQNLLISYIDVDESLLATQTKKEIALQQQTQYDQEALAQQKYIGVQEQTARAAKQPEVVQSILQVQINENLAKARVKQAEGTRDSTQIEADGNAAAVIKVGQAQADAYRAQAKAIGPENVSMIKLIDEIGANKVRITPDTLVTTGGGDAGTSSLFSAYLATQLAKKNKASEVASD